MHPRALLPWSAALVMTVVGSAVVSADPITPTTLLDTFPNFNYAGTTFPARFDNGPGQGIDVLTTTELTAFGFYMSIPSGGTAKFVIFNGGNDRLLASQVVSVAPAPLHTLTLATLPTPFTLEAGSTYFLGVISTSDLTADFFPVSDMSSHGLSLHNPNTNYSHFAQPEFGGTANATAAIALEGFQNVPSPTPEPATLVLLSSGLVAVIGRTRRKGPSGSLKQRP